MQVTEGAMDNVTVVVGIQAGSGLAPRHLNQHTPVASEKDPLRTQ